MKKLKVLMVSYPFYPVYSGAAKQLFTLLSQLELHKDLKIRVITSKPNSEVRKHLSVSYLCDYERGWYSKYIFALRSLFYCLIHPDQYDILHIHGAYWFQMFPLMAAKMWKKRSLIKLSLLGNDDPLSMRKQKLGWVKQRLVSLSDFFVCVNQELVGCCERYFKKGNKRFIYIPNGVDAEKNKPITENAKADLRKRLKIDSLEGVAIFVGRITPRKGITELLDIWHYIIENKKIRLLIIGPEEKGYVSYIENKMRDLEIQKYVSLVRYNLEIEKYYQIADIFVFCSYMEGLPNSVLEAMSNGLPVIAFDLPQLRGIVQKKFLIKNRNVGEFARLILDIFTDREQMRRIGIRNRQYILENLSIKKIAAQYINLYYSMRY